MKAIFDYFLTQLNDNTDSLVYKGNFLFKFFTDKMVVYEPVEGKIVNEAVPYRPVALMVQEAVPFVEDNERVDWLVQLGILVPIKGQVFDEDDDLDYANIKSVCESLNGTKVTTDTKVYAYKVSPYPKYEGWDFIGKSKYAILTVTMNVTEAVNAGFGQDEVYKLDTVAMDVVNADIVMVRRYYVTDNKSSLTNDYNQPIGRVMQWTLTINYDSTNAACVELMKERKGSSLLSKTYTLAEGSDTYTVSVKNASENKVRNGVRQLVVQFVEVE